MLNVLTKVVAMNPISIGIAGTAKNTGKTTTTVALADFLYSRGYKVGLTSIGYDGEPIDTLSGLPKPRHIARKNDIVATASGCLGNSVARVEILQECPCHTPLGPVLIVRVRKEGLITLVGPNKASSLALVIKTMQECGAQWTLCDGALNRIAPLSVTDGLILATGASRSVNIEQLGKETALLSRCLSFESLYPSPSIPRNTVCLNTPQGVTLYSSPISSLLTASSMIRLMHSIDEIPQGSYLSVPGPLSYEALSTLADSSKARGIHIVLGSPLNLLMSQNLEGLARCLDELEEKDCRIVVYKRIPLLGLTVNPSYHAYDHIHGTYSLQTVDAGSLLECISTHSNVLTLNIVQSGALPLFQNILRTFNGEPHGKCI